MVFILLKANSSRWAWQNTHLTRHIPDDERITARHNGTKTSPRTGKTRKRVMKPRISLIDKLSNLHLLLRVSYFSRWPLEVRFFCEDVYQVWQRHCATVGQQLRPEVKIIAECLLSKSTADAQLTHDKSADGLPQTGIGGLDVGYTPLKSHLEKSQFILASDEPTNCSVCATPLNLENERVLVCSQQECNSTSHLSCLSNRFLREEQSDALLPSAGTCPACHGRLRWADLIKEMSLRDRGHREVVQLFKKKRQKKGASGIIQPSSQLSDEDDRDEPHVADMFDELGSSSKQPFRRKQLHELPDDLASVTSLDADWFHISDSESDSKFASSKHGLEAVLEESDLEV